MYYYLLCSFHSCYYFLPGFLIIEPFGVELEEGMADGGGEGVLFPAPGGGVRSV